MQLLRLAKNIFTTKIRLEFERFSGCNSQDYSFNCLLHTLDYTRDIISYNDLLHYTL